MGPPPLSCVVRDKGRLLDSPSGCVTVSHLVSRTHSGLIPGQLGHDITPHHQPTLGGNGKDEPHTDELAWTLSLEVMQWFVTERAHNIA